MIRVHGVKHSRANSAASGVTHVGDWRVLCRIEDARLIVLVVDLEHRREIYR